MNKIIYAVLFDYIGGKLLPINKLFYHLKGYLEQGKLQYKIDTPFNNIRVVDKKGFRYLVFIDKSKPLYLQRPENVYQTYMDLRKPFRTKVTYADYFHLAWIFNEKIKNICMIGLGGGAVSKQFLLHYPEVEFNTVEIDAEVVKIAHKYFYLPRSPRHKIVVDDGRNFIKTTAKVYDYVILDAFFSRSIPHSLFTQEFYKEIKLKLADRGLIGINFNGALQGKNSILFHNIFHTLSSVLPKVYVFASKMEKPLQMQNIILFGVKSNTEVTQTDILEAAQKAGKKKPILKEYLPRVKELYTFPIELQDTNILQDRFPPENGLLNLYCDD